MLPYLLRVPKVPGGKQITFKKNIPFSQQPQQNPPKQHQTNKSIILTRFYHLNSVKCIFLKFLPVELGIKG
jgi:hypothetical protein